MSEGMFSRHAALNAGAIPASAEELSQRYLKLFQQYSRLKAQHAVLKKAVIKEQASNVALQGNVKEKEKELRKLQEQLDLLAFHNERLTKRIQAVQDNEQKGNHFSLLERKIVENEKLHEELTERQFEFTESINTLLQQIQDLEKKVTDLQDENANLQAESKNDASADQTQPESSQHLNAELESLKKELKEKTEMLEERTHQAQQNDMQMVSEIQSLRAILLAKIGSMNKEESSLYDIFPAASDALKALEAQANQYILSNGDKTDMKQLPSDMAEKLAISTETYSQELLHLLKQLDDTKAELNKLLKEKDAELQHTKEKSQQHSQEFEQKIQAQNDKIKDLVATIETNQKSQTDAVSNLEAINKTLQDENERLQKELELQKSSLVNAEKELNDTKELMKSKDTTDKEIQVDSTPDGSRAQAAEGDLDISQPKDEMKDEEEDDDEVFVYPSNPHEEPKKQEEDDEDEEVFVYRGMDAVVPESEAKTNTEPVATANIGPEKIYDQDDMNKREAKMKTYYEQQLAQLTEKIQMTDSKAFRFAAMYKSLKDRLIQEDKEKQMMVTEIERLNKEVKNVQDLLATTESNYQKQVDTMTEFISSLQQNQEEQSRQHHQQQQTPQRRNNNYHNQR
ncbi:hypothetical protein HMPREF1544_00245 [Mucor circinelloides 1006PhL]|uniref:Protein phosphatase 1 regulatory subunit 21 N-terminal domain-containing protein n=1 Tax=Mucor circinelloides f. circinelloides (strain 1006PhL) TaxID=1220926 RepID=S2JRD2_MUCC1|nr:hypothetical protein HMPREF1544_00245 [Mucor circinelloides 1006PhL]